MIYLIIRVWIRAAFREGYRGGVAGPFVGSAGNCSIIVHVNFDSTKLISRTSFTTPVFVCLFVCLFVFRALLFLRFGLVSQAAAAPNKLTVTSSHHYSYHSPFFQNHGPTYLHTVTCIQSLHSKYNRLRQESRVVLHRVQKGLALGCSRKQSILKNRQSFAVDTNARQHTPRKEGRE